MGTSTMPIHPEDSVQMLLDGNFSDFARIDRGYSAGCILLTKSKSELHAPQRFHASGCGGGQPAEDA